jgi:hypothetical protein
MRHAHRILVREPEEKGILRIQRVKEEEWYEIRQEGTRRSKLTKITCAELPEKHTHQYEMENFVSTAQISSKIHVYMTMMMMIMIIIIITNKGPRYTNGKFPNNQSSSKSTTNV